MVYVLQSMRNYVNCVLQSTLCLHPRQVTLNIGRKCLKVLQTIVAMKIHFSSIIDDIHAIIYGQLKTTDQNIFTVALQVD